MKEKFTRWSATDKDMSKESINTTQEQESRFEINIK